MKFRPILFSTPMVQAIMGGNKTQTRRIMGDGTSFGYRPKGWANGGIRILDLSRTPENELADLIGYCKYGEIGDVLWVRETWSGFPKMDESNYYYYKADNVDSKFRWKPSIHMPKEAARIFLRITDIRVERLQDISHSDSINEGIEYLGTGDEGPEWKCYNSDKFCHLSPNESFESLWASINGEESWNENPWVWVIEFERIEKPQNFIP